MRLYKPKRIKSADPASRLRPVDLLSEALAGILQRPARTTLTMLGTVIGVGAFTAILGLTSTAQGQVSTDFSVLGATQVTVKDVGDATEQAEPGMYDFPANPDQTIERLNGVVHAGVKWSVFASAPSISAQDTPPTSGQSSLTVFAASPGYLQAIDPVVREGALIDSFEDSRHLRVAVLGQAAANELGISNLTAQPAVFINGIGYTVIGVIADDRRDPEDLLSVLIPDQTALVNYGLPSPQSPAQMLIETKLGAADLIARQAPLALRADRPGLFQAVAPPDPRSLQNAVNASLDSLFLLLAALTLAIGTIGIANTTLVAVMERVGEIGLRRALGAKPRHVAVQFLTETTLLGTVGGLIGTALGIGVVLGVAIDHHWTALLNPATTLPAPLIGTLTGLIAGAYPSLRAARILPLEALRR